MTNHGAKPARHVGNIVGTRRNSIMRFARNDAINVPTPERTIANSDTMLDKSTAINGAMLGVNAVSNGVTLERINEVSEAMSKKTIVSNSTMPERITANSEAMPGKTTANSETTFASTTPIDGTISFDRNKTMTKKHDQPYAGTRCHNLVI